MQHFLDTISIPLDLLSETDNSVTKFIGLLNEAVGWINNYDSIARNQQLTLLKTTLDRIDETNEKFNIFRQGLNEIVKSELKKQKRKEKLEEKNTIEQFDLLISEDLCAIYNGIRSVEYMLVNLIKYLENNFAEYKILIDILKNFLDQVTETKQSALDSMKKRLQVYAAQEETNRRAEAQSHTVLQNSTIGSMIDIPNISSASVDADSQSNIKVDSLIGSFTQVSPPLEQSFHYIHSTHFKPNGEVLDLSKSQQDTSINKFMTIDVFIYPCFPSRKIGDQLNVTIYDYFKNQTESENSHEIPHEIQTINKAFLIEKKAKSWLSYFTDLFKPANKTESCSQEISQTSVNTTNRKIETEPNKLGVLSDSDFYSINRLSSMITATTKGIENYLALNRNHLSFWTRLFDGDRGYNRAKQYQSLFSQFEQHGDENQKYKMQMALLAALMLSHDGKTLKNEIVNQINYSKFFTQRSESSETVAKIFLHKLDDVRQQLIDEIKTILSNNADRIKIFNKQFLKPFVLHINNKKTVPGNVFEVLVKVLELDSSMLALKNCGNRRFHREQ